MSVADTHLASYYTQYHKLITENWLPGAGHTEDGVRTFVSTASLSYKMYRSVATQNIQKRQGATTLYFCDAMSYVSSVCALHKHENKLFTRSLMTNNIRISIQSDQNLEDISRTLLQWTVDVGVLVDGDCGFTDLVLFQASKSKLFDAEHIWLVLAPTRDDNDTSNYIEEKFQHVNLSINSDVVVVNGNGSDYSFTDVFNFGRIQGNDLEMVSLGEWSVDNGLNLAFKGFKYYHRWDFHNLTLRAVSVILDQPDEFDPELLSSIGYTPGIAAMTKITSQLLNLLKEIHNFRFVYTIAGRWIGSPERNTTLGVTNSLLWEEQDVSSTCARIFPQWLNWVDICFPPTTDLQTKFYYLIPDKGVGDYENRFLTPMSAGVWWSTLAACIVCTFVLAAAAYLEMRPKPGLYAFFSVYAAICQQDFDDGAHDGEKQSQGRKLTLLVVGLTSMLLYNYYTSSVVSWLLNAATPSIDSLDGLISSDLELIFEDVGYTRGWVDSQKTGFAYYYSGFVNLKEDELREKKVTRAKRTVNILQPIETGVELIRSGEYAYHTEPYTASQAIARTFSDDELCELGDLQMMTPSNVYIMVQKRSPYKQFFVWSLMRLAERGHFAASRLRFAGTMPSCSGRRPRALALGQAAPAFALLLQLTILSAFILAVEVWWDKHKKSREVQASKKRPFVR